MLLKKPEDYWDDVTMNLFLDDLKDLFTAYGVQCNGSYSSVSEEDISNKKMNKTIIGW